MTKDNNGVYTLADFLGSEVPFSFTFPEANAGEYADMTVTSPTIEGEYFPYFADADGYTLRCYLWKYKNTDGWTVIDSPYFYYEDGWPCVYLNTDEDIEEYGYKYSAMLYVNGFIPDDPESDDPDYTATGWFYVMFDFNDVLSPAELEAYNQEAYDKVIAEIEEVQAEYDAAVKDIEAEYPGIDLGEWKEIIANQIAEAKTGAKQQLDAANEDGVKFNFPFSAEEYKGMIKEMKNAAPNLAAYSKVMETINGLQKEYEEALALVKELHPDYNSSEMEEVIENAINEAKQGAEQALNATYDDEGAEFNFPFDGEEIQNMITMLKAGPVMEANTAAYEKVMETINGLEKEYQEALAEVKEQYPDFDTTEMEGIIEKAINEAKTGAEMALFASFDDSADYNFPFDGEEIQNMINQMKEDAKQSGIANIEAEVAAGQAKIYTLDGKTHVAPVKGQVNVIVRGNSAVKVMVK